jgi:hypothetical protein
MLMDGNREVGMALRGFNRKGGLDGPPFVVNLVGV